MNLERSVRILKDPPTFRPRDTAVLICPPLSMWRYTLQWWLGKDVTKYLGLYSEFAEIVGEHPVLTLLSWSRMLRTARKTVGEIAGAGARIICDARLQDVVDTSADESIRLIFLVGHHRQSSGEFEFADKPEKWNNLQTAFPPRVSTVLMVCHSEPVAARFRILRSEALVGGLQGTGYFTSILQFLKLWIEELDHRDFLDARDAAIGRFYERPVLDWERRLDAERDTN